MCKLSKDVSIADETELQFWYFMYGLQLGTLELIANSDTVLWSLTGGQANNWMSANVKLPAGNYLVIFYHIN